MDGTKRILVLHDGDPIGSSIVRQLEAAQAPAWELRGQVPADEVVNAAFGSRAIISVGDRPAADPAVLSAANMPGVRALVLVVREATDFSALRKRGVPYTVLRPAPLLEELVAALEPCLAAGRLVLEAGGDVPLGFIAAADVAACAIAAVDADDYCGRLVELAAPEPVTLSALATRLAQAQGRPLKVSAWPRWVLAAMRALGRRPFRLPEALQRPVPREDLSPLHRSWSSVEEVASAVLERRDDHAVGVQ